jgi:hypothetical protein
MDLGEYVILLQERSVPEAGSIVISTRNSLASLFFSSFCYRTQGVSFLGSYIMFISSCFEAAFRK